MEPPDAAPADIDGGGVLEALDQVQGLDALHPARVCRKNQQQNVRTLSVQQPATAADISLADVAQSRQKFSHGFLEEAAVTLLALQPMVCAVALG